MQANSSRTTYEVVAASIVFLTNRLYIDVFKLGQRDVVYTLARHNQAAGILDIPMPK